MNNYTADVGNSLFHLSLEKSFLKLFTFFCVFFNFWRRQTNTGKGRQRGGRRRRTKQHGENNKTQPCGGEPSKKKTTAYVRVRPDVRVGQRRIPLVVGHGLQVRVDAVPVVPNVTRGAVPAVGRGGGGRMNHMREGTRQRTVQSHETYLYGYTACGSVGADGMEL